MEEIKVGSPYFKEHTKYYSGWQYFRVNTIEYVKSQIVLGLIPITKKEYDTLSLTDL